LAVDITELASVVADALAGTGRSLDDLTATEAIEIADTLRTIAAAGIVERHTGTG
jgi:hypothetical protein